MAYRIAIIAAATAAGLLAAFGPWGQPASANPAKFVRCLTNPLAITTEGHGMWGTSDRTRGRAISEWQSAASQQIGVYYGSWANALGGTVECHRDLFKVTCIATATPCRT